MAKWTISKFFSLVMFLLMMAILFFWMISQVTDMALLFGFRTSHTVANDVTNLITSLGGVPGDAVTFFEITSTTKDARKFHYEIQVSDKIVCATSFLGDGTEEDMTKATTDCASHPYDIEKDVVCETIDGNLRIGISKIIHPVTKEPTMSITESTAGRCNDA